MLLLLQLLLLLRRQIQDAYCNMLRYDLIVVLVEVHLKSRNFAKFCCGGSKEFHLTDL